MTVVESGVKRAWWSRFHSPLQVRCPIDYCQAKVAQPCRNVKGKPQAARFHYKRYHLWKLAVKP